MKTLSRFKFYHLALILSVPLLFSCSKSTDKPTASYAVSTTSVTAITQTTATTGGSITVTSGTLAIIEKGVCYGTTVNPNASLPNIRKPFSDLSLSAFTSNLTGLTANTTYHVRAYAISESGVKYGNDVTFTTSSITLVIPSLTTAAATSITQTTATSGGNITSNGGATITASGICYSTTANPTIADSKVTSTILTGVFTSNLTGLLSNTTYYVRAYATNSVGTAYGSQETFKTLANLPTVTTTTVTSINQTTAISGGNITVTDGAALTTRGVCWSTTANPTIANSKTSDGTTTGAFSSNLSGLTAGTTYHVRAYATNSAGTAYGSDVTFTTTMLTVGQSYQGGIIAYILQSGDAGYNSTVQHGLIAATSDQSVGIRWVNDRYISIATSASIGRGSSNTDEIVSKQGTGVYAAQLCQDLTLNGYSDWYLPSMLELDKLYTNLKLNNIGGLTTTKYWSSTQVSSDEAIYQDFSTGITITNDYKSRTFSVRAIRSF